MQALRLSRSWKPTKLTRIAYPPFNAAVNLANPTALVGLTAVNGSAVTAMRSDGAPPLDQTAAFAFSNLGQTSVVGASFGLSGNFTAALTTNGTRYKNAAATITDNTTAAGTVAVAYTDIWGGNTIATGGNAITVTNYYGSYFKAPVAGSGITFTHSYALGADSLNVTGASLFGGALIGADGGAWSSTGIAGLTGLSSVYYALSPSNLITEATTSRTLVATDNGKTILCTSGSAVTITVPSGLGAGFTVTVIQMGAGQVGFATSGTTINSFGTLTHTAGQYAGATLISTATDVFALSGNLS